MAVSKQAKRLAYRQISMNFAKWFKANPNASLERQAQAFNAIADSELDQTKNSKIEPLSKKLVKRI